VETPIAKDRAPTVDASIAREVREPSARFLDDDRERGVIPWTAAEQDDSIECPRRNE
jgi:hypothetical protein